MSKVYGSDTVVKFSVDTGYVGSTREEELTLEELGRYEQLLEVARENPDWDNKEISKELAERIRKKTSLG
ncbi:hypothetical protein BSP12_169 [Bacillus phage BSP12]|nr:hypothetical protein BSP12_169 [Bacillus phage BSP12]